MSRTATGHIIEKETRTGLVYGARFPAYGKKRYATLGVAADGWTRERAEVALADILSDVRRGIWRPAQPEPVIAPREVPTFHEFASEWFERQKVEGGRRGGGLTAAGIADLEWRLSVHLLPFFKSMRLDAITVEEVDCYRLVKVKAKKLNATSINKCLATLSAILETAVEYGHAPRNVAHGRRRRLPSVTPARTSLDRAQHITALLDAAGKLDSDAITRHGQRRALVATLVFAGLRISEALALRWRDVDLARGTIVVRASKTDAGVRTINIVPALRDELSSYRARTHVAADALVFGTSTGRPQHRSQIRSRILAKAIERANTKLAETDTELLPSGLTLHSLRRTFASLLFAIGETPPYVMGQMGHTTAELTLAMYARQMNRRDGEPKRLKALVQGADWTLTDTHGDLNLSSGSVSERV
jgi:integrase